MEERSEDKVKFEPPLKNMPLFSLKPTEGRDKFYDIL
jgi:hypothetical protein